MLLAQVAVLLLGSLDELEVDEFPERLDGLVFDADGTGWVAEETALWRFRPPLQFEPVALDAGVLALGRASSGRVAVATAGALVEPSTGARSALPLSTASIRALSFDRDATLVLRGSRRTFEVVRMAADGTTTRLFTSPFDVGHAQSDGERGFWLTPSDVTKHAAHLTTEGLELRETPCWPSRPSTQQGTLVFSCSGVLTRVAPDGTALASSEKGLEFVTSSTAADVSLEVTSEALWLHGAAGPERVPLPKWHVFHEVFPRRHLLVQQGPVTFIASADLMPAALFMRSERGWSVVRGRVQVEAVRQARRRDADGSSLLALVPVVAWAAVGATSVVLVGQPPEGRLVARLIAADVIGIPFSMLGVAGASMLADSNGAVRLFGGLFAAVSAVAGPLLSAFAANGLGDLTVPEHQRRGGRGFGAGVMGGFIGAGGAAVVLLIAEHVQVPWVQRLLQGLAANGVSTGVALGLELLR